MKKFLQALGFFALGFMVLSSRTTGAFVFGPVIDLAKGRFVPANFFGLGYRGMMLYVATAPHEAPIAVKIAAGIPFVIDGALRAINMALTDHFEIVDLMKKGKSK